MSKMPLYQALFRKFEHKKALQVRPGFNSLLEDQVEEHLTQLLDLLPSGSGFDNGTKMDFEKSTLEKLVFNTSFHHMDENGYYCGWTDHVVTVTPAFIKFNVKVSGRNYRNIKGYIDDLFYNTLLTDVDYPNVIP